MFDLIKNAVKRLGDVIKSSQKKKEDKLKVKQSLTKKIVTHIQKKHKIEKKEIEEALDEFELMLIEADVAFEVASFLKQEVERELVGKEVDIKELDSIINKAIRSALERILIEPPDFLSIIGKKRERPFVILFFGVNGVGKTTTIAKIANMLVKHGFKVVLSAADTFRKGAIEQLSEWGKKLNLPVIKRPYGHSPSSVVYDAISYAKAKDIDVVLIDTAGRQEVNVNLMKELQKIARVSNADLKLFVTEAIAGNAVYDQIKEYNEIVGLDGIIITKVDLNKKGGVAISVSYATNLPIFFICYGQDLEDIKPFKKEEIINQILE